MVAYERDSRLPAGSHGACECSDERQTAFAFVPSLIVCVSGCNLVPVRQGALAQCALLLASLLSG